MITMSLNKITLSGNLGADAELRYTKSGNPVVSFSLAVNERTPIRRRHMGRIHELA